MITGVILTHNEEQNIVACIEHLRPHVGEIILVDTQSTDRTVELARPLVDRVLSHPHVPNFDAARNIAVPEARYEWLWFVDADEHVPELTGRLVNQWIREQRNASAGRGPTPSKVECADRLLTLAARGMDRAPVPLIVYLIGWLLLAAGAFSPLEWL